VYRATASLPQGAAQGTWTVSFFSLVDRVGNKTNLSAADPAAAGMPTSFRDG
jgi:hypothetical protein